VAFGYIAVYLIPSNQFSPQRAAEKENKIECMYFIPLRSLRFKLFFPLRALRVSVVETVFLRNSKRRQDAECHPFPGAWMIETKLNRREHQAGFVL